MLSQYHATASAYYVSKYLGSKLKVKNDPFIKYVAIGGVVTSTIKNFLSGMHVSKLDFVGRT
jgi:hypothetical protein